MLVSTIAAALFAPGRRSRSRAARGSGFYLYPSLAVLAPCPLLVRVLPRRAVYSGASLAVLGWRLAANTLRPNVFDDGSTATFVVLGSLLTFSAVFLLSQNRSC